MLEKIYAFLLRGGVYKVEMKSESPQEKIKETDSKSYELSTAFNSPKSLDLKSRQKLEIKVPQQNIKKTSAIRFEDLNLEIDQEQSGAGSNLSKDDDNSDSSDSSDYE